MTGSESALFDPIGLAESVRKDVCSGDSRKYYRFRPSRFYGGISTGDCVGCCLRCLFCWSWNVVSHPQGIGKFYAPRDVARTLMGIARKRHIHQIRISGNEPTLCWEHLIMVLEQIEGNSFVFILETNGILIGKNEEYAKDLSRFKNLQVRVSLKGTCEREFSKLTGALPLGFDLQLNALETLVRHKVECHPACMVSFSLPENIGSLKKKLREIDPQFEDFETEELILYPHVEERLRKLNVPYYAAYEPDRIPPEQI